jgi:hypothetical protein
MFKKWSEGNGLAWSDSGYVQVVGVYEYGNEPTGRVSWEAEGWVLKKDSDPSIYLVRYLVSPLIGSKKQDVQSYSLYHVYVWV